MNLNKLNEMPTKASTQTQVLNAKQFPFLIVETNRIESTSEEDISHIEYQIAINNQIISEKIFDTIDEVNEYIDSKPWELFINLIGITYEIMKSNEEFKPKH